MVKIIKTFQVKRDGEVVNKSVGEYIGVAQILRDKRIKSTVEVMSNKTVYIGFYNGSFYEGILLSMKQLENIFKEANRK